MSKLTYIDLFAGAGGLSEGFIRAGFEPIAHVEMDKAACFTLKTRVAYYYWKDNNPDKYTEYLRGDIDRETLYRGVPLPLMESVINLPIGEETNSEIMARIDNTLGKRKVDLIIGGPPCQAYSIAGRSRSKTRMEGDPRNYLFVQYAEYLEKYQPKMFVFENVLGLTSAKEGQYLEEMKMLFKQKGFKFKLFRLDATDFGVLQNRRRVIILGWKKNLDMNIPDLELIKSNASFNVRELLDDLPELQAGQGNNKFQNYKTEKTEYLEVYKIRNGIEILTQHVARPNRELDKNIYKIAVKKWDENMQRLNYNDLPEKLKTHSNRSAFTDRFKVVAGNLSYSQTIVAHIAKDGHYYIHPDINQNRSISVREAARLQSFPDDYYFEGEKESANRTAAFKQIGNAVPPLMAEEIAEEIKELL